MRRSANHPPDRQEPSESVSSGQSPVVTGAMAGLPGLELAAAPLHKWLCDDDVPHSEVHAGNQIIIDELVVLRPGQSRVDLRNVRCRGMT